MDNTSRENSAAHKLKDVVIEGMINSYKPIPKIQIEKRWKKAGTYVYEDNEKAPDGSGYYSAWDESTQNDATTGYAEGKLLHEGMRGVISDIEGKVSFIPKAGRKKKQAAEEVTDLAAEAMEVSVEETAASSLQFSEYVSPEYPDEFLMKRHLKT